MSAAECTNSPVPTPVPLSAVEQGSTTRLPAGVPARPAAATSPDPAQQARRALLWYLATSTPMPHPGMPTHADVPILDLIRMLSGLMDEGPVSSRWLYVVDAADNLARFLADGGACNPTGQRWLEDLLADAINSAAPDRSAP